MAVDKARHSFSAIDCFFRALEVAFIFIGLDLLATEHASIFVLVFKFEDIADHVLRELLPCEDPDDEVTRQLEETKESTNISH